eukprot:EG_transcript_17829
MAKVLGQVIRSNTVDSTRCNLIDCLTLSCAGADAQQLRQLRDTEGLFPAITSHLVSPHAHVKAKVRALLGRLAPADTDVLGHPDLPPLLVATQHSFIFAPSPPSPTSADPCGEPKAPAAAPGPPPSPTVPRSQSARLALGAADPADHSSPCHRISPVLRDLRTDASAEPPEDEADSAARALPCIDTSLAGSDPDVAGPRPSPLGFTTAAPPPRPWASAPGGPSPDSAAPQWEASTTPLPQAPAAGYGDDHCCSVCLEEYVAGDEVTEYVCGHRFHRSCLEHWLKDSFVC